MATKASIWCVYGDYSEMIVIARTKGEVYLHLINKEYTSYPWTISGIGEQQERPPMSDYSIHFLADVEFNFPEGVYVHELFIHWG